MDAFQAVLETIRQDADTQQLPPFLNETIELFSKAHIYYCTFKQTQLFEQASKDPSQGHPAVYGAAIQLAGDYTTISSYALTIALVTKCTEDLLHEYRQLNTDYQNLLSAFEWQYPVYQPIPRRRATNDSMFLSPSFYYFSQIQVMRLVKQILKVARYALTVFWQSFKISMCLCDAYLMLQGDSRARYEACTELVAKWASYHHQLKNEYSRLLEEIEQSCDLADRILKRLGATKDSLFVIEALKPNIAQMVDRVEDEIEDLYDVAERAVDAVYVKGKITPLQINLAEGKAAPLALPQGRFPPWAGQKLSLIIPNSSNQQHAQLVEKFILNNLNQGKLPLPFEDSLKGVVWLASQINLLYKNQLQTASLVSALQNLFKHDQK